MRVAVVGLGRIGLPLAVQYAARGIHVTGCDTNPSVVNAVQAGIAPFTGEAHLDERLAVAHDTGLIEATTNTTQAVRHADVVVVIVPVGVTDNGAPDLHHLQAAIDAIGAGLQPGTLVLIETTVPLGTTRVMSRRLSEQCPLIDGDGFNVVFSPERVLVGQIFDDLAAYPKIIGARTRHASQSARAFYETALGHNRIIDVGTPEAAELVKLAETTYRDVNIALANTFATAAERIGANAQTVIDAANTQPHSHIHTPGMVGGHCIPVYPQLLQATDPSLLVLTARQVNATLPARFAATLATVHGCLTGQHVVILGAAFRGDTPSTAGTQAIPLAHALSGMGATVAIHDPVVTDDDIRTMGIPAHVLGNPADAAIVHTAHTTYQGMTRDDLPGVRTILDTRGILDPTKFDGINLRRFGDGR